MSEISDSARVSLFLADFARGDNTGKLNIIGAGIGITGRDPQTGQSAPFAVVVVANVNPRFRGQEYALELALYDSAGDVFVPPGPIEQQAVRVAQMVVVEHVAAPQGTYIPTDTVWPGAQMVVNFTTGLPLTLGTAYEWRASIDQAVVARAGLYMSGPPPVVIG